MMKGRAYSQWILGHKSRNWLNEIGKRIDKFFLSYSIYGSIHNIVLSAMGNWESTKNKINLFLQEVEHSMRIYFVYAHLVLKNNEKWATPFISHVNSCNKYFTFVMDCHELIKVDQLATFARYWLRNPMNTENNYKTGLLENTSKCLAITLSCPSQTAYLNTRKYTMICHW